MENRTISPEIPTPPPAAAPIPTPPPSVTPGPPSVLSQAQLERVKARLQERGVAGSCPRCGTPEFTVVGNGILKPALQDLSESTTLGGSTIPTLVTVCVKCGFLSLHALGMLGFLKGGKVDI
jgi:hypothetical protein